MLPTWVSRSLSTRNSKQVSRLCFNYARRANAGASGDGMDSPSLLLGVCDRDVDELGVFGLLDSGKDEGRVRGRVLGLVDSDGCEAADDCQLGQLSSRAEQAADNTS